MTESAKTITFVAAAGVLLIAAIVSRPAPPVATSEGGVGQALLTDWKEPQSAKSLEITTLVTPVNSTTARAHVLKIAQAGGEWTIPSHGGFPANAEDHVIKAAQSLINLKILGVVSDLPGDHETYGVVQPPSDEIQPAAPGAGKMVTVRDGAGTALAQLVIGKEDRSPSGSEGANLRFVRLAGKDRVYRVELPTDVFSSNFADWIDTDLLGLKQHWDITKVDVRDYSLAQTDDGNLAIERKSDVDLEFNDQKSAWTLAKLTDYKDNKPTTVDKLPADEELDTQKLNDAKMNLAGLKIVDVVDKPKPFVGELKKHESFYGDDAALQSLEEMAILAFPSTKPKELFAAGGDTTIAMKDGVEYSIRFGGTKLSMGEKDDSADKGAADAKDSKKDDKKDGAKKPKKIVTDKTGKKAAKGAETQRAVFVTARFNEDSVPKAVLEPMPTGKKPEAAKPDDNKKPATTKLDDKSPDAPKPDAKKPEEKKPEEKKPDEKKPDEKKPEPSKSSDAKKSDENYAEDAAASDAKDTVKKEAATKDADKKAAGDKAAVDKKPADKANDKAPPAKPDATKPDANKQPDVDKQPDGAKPPDSGIKRAEEEEKLEADRKRVEAANKQKTDQYNEAIKKGKQHAKELNDRFADWFYFISEEDYNKVHLGRSDILKKKPVASADKNQPSPLGTVPTDPFQLPKK